MEADKFFSQRRGVVHKRRIEAERFGLSVGDAKKMLRKKVAKPSINDIEFESWQLELANRIFGMENK